MSRNRFLLPFALLTSGGFALSQTSPKISEKTIATYEDYLVKFPEGMFSRSARLETGKLRAAERRRGAEEARQAAEQRAAQDRVPRLVVSGVAMEFVRIQPGEFQMGSDSGVDDEKPSHRVRITKVFELGKHEVTQAQWEAVMGGNPSNFKGADRPVELVSWNDVQEFLGKLNARGDGYRYRLPTEAEWTYAARAGTAGDWAGNLDSVAWYRENSGTQTHPVGQKQANAWGLHDMLGNVWEWCQDWYDKEYYRSSPADDPQGASSGEHRTRRGGGWVGVPAYVRVAYRGKGKPDGRYSDLGFRCARERFP
ncbi:MAG: formylglycine-generating enzyme family protein [Candidatus Solibacter sp.]|nr:formylglycine-generating enzyme family protein [Candidatus Solibacter sp.]